MAPLRPDPPLYAAVALDYLDSGVGFPLPLPPQAKQYPPKGVTGRLGVDPSPGKVKAWCRSRQPRTNVALRLVTGVIGIDVDAYGGKQGERTLTRLEQLLGSLPATVVSTSRTDGVSGIGLFQVPPGRLWTPSVRAQQQDGSVTAHIDVIQRSHRYAVVWPSFVRPAHLAVDQRGPVTVHHAGAGQEGGRRQRHGAEGENGHERLLPDQATAVGG